MSLAQLLQQLPSGAVPSAVTAIAPLALLLQQLPQRVTAVSLALSLQMCSCAVVTGCAVVRLRL